MSKRDRFGGATAKDEKKVNPGVATAVDTPPAAAAIEPALEAPAADTGAHAQVAALAYAHWEARGCPDGSPEEDWYCAENELRQTAGAAAQTA
jgi:hypothetical protein